jgi:UDP-N-acetyl-D-mannosaminuronic acid dehydrogenase
MSSLSSPNLTKITIVGGGGHVGLPLALVLARRGFRVTSYDTNDETVANVSRGSIPFREEGAEVLLKEVLQNEKFSIVNDPNSVSNADIVIVVIGTPVDEHLSPDPMSVIGAVNDLLPYMNRNQLLILRSTIFPGVSNKLASEVRKIFPDLQISFCPERIVEGQALSELEKLPQIIGTDSDFAFKRSQDLFTSLGVSCIRTSFEEAELAKLFTNVWRYIKFSAANQFWMMANELNVDYENVRNAISFEYPRAADLPHAGFAAGPCLFKDTMQLSALVQQNFPLGHSAMMVNEGTPGFLVQTLEKKYDLSNLRVGILGMAFKANVDDTRSSLAYKLRKLLVFKSKEVLITDPFVRDERIISLEDVLEKSDIVIIGAPHEVYRNLKTNKPIIDIWGLFGRGALI